MALRRQIRLQLTLAVVVLLGGLARLVSPPPLSAGDNMEAAINSGSEIIDRAWDRRYYDGTPGWDGFVEWRYNDDGRPFSTKAGVEGMIQAGYDTWSAINGTTGLGTPLVPIWQQGPDTTVDDAGALDGINAIVWIPGSPGGFLASAPCTWLTTPATTVDDGSGNAVIPFAPPIGNFPVPGPVGATYPAGTVLDCGIQIDSAENWVDGAGGPGTIDFVSVMTHEEGHTNSVSHSTVGETTNNVAADEATMSPFVFGNNTDYRTLAEDDVASIVRFLSRFNGLPETTGGRAVITGVLKEGGSCDPATGVSVRAYLGTVESANTVETFSWSQFRAGSNDGRFELNVIPGGPYTIYARQFERAGSGFYLQDRYNLTTLNSNFDVPPNQSTPLDDLGTVGSISAGQTLNIGDVGIEGCVGSTLGVNTVESGRYETPVKTKDAGVVFVAGDIFNVGDHVILRALVVDGMGLPVADATVEIALSGPESLSLTTAPSGADGWAYADWQTHATADKKGNDATNTGLYTATITNVTKDGGPPWDGGGTSTQFTLQ